MLFRPFLVVVCLLTMGDLLAQDASQLAELRLFGFEVLPTNQRGRILSYRTARSKNHLPTLSVVAGNFATGKHSLKITFRGGVWPTVIMTRVPEDWTSWHTFHADVTATRPCVVGFCVMQEASLRAPGWDDGVSRGAKTQFLQPGRNTTSANLHPNEWSALRTKLENGRVLGKVVSLEIFLYRPHDGESIFVDNIRVSAMKEPTPPATKTPFKVLGTDLPVTGVQELGKKLSDQWTMSESQTAEQLEARFRSQYDELKRTHPRAVLALLRDGEKGYDPNDPAKEHSPLKPNMWAIEACDRHWSETEVDAYRYAGDKYWKAIDGIWWERDNPDFLAGLCGAWSQPARLLPLGFGPSRKVLDRRAARQSRLYASWRLEGLVPGLVSRSACHQKPFSGACDLRTEIVRTCLGFMPETSHL